MAVQETNIFKLGCIKVSRLGTRIFRNNVGLFTTDRGTKVVTGLCKGSTDGIGWTPIIVTPEMVGMKIAVFTALESKTPTGRVTPEQNNFVQQVDQGGGISGVFRSPEEAEGIVRSWIKRVGARLCS